MDMIGRFEMKKYLWLLVVIVIMVTCYSTTALTVDQTDSTTVVPLTLIAKGNDEPHQPIVEINAGSQPFDVLLDTGSSWLIINNISVNDTFTYMDTGEKTTVSYGGGGLTASGRVCTTNVSIGDLPARPVKFLLIDGGSYHGTGTLGINTWNSGYPLDIPIQALDINQYQITLPTARQEAGKWVITDGEWVVNGQPNISAAMASGGNLYTFTVPNLSSNNRVAVNAQAVSGSLNKSVNLLLDTGTPGQTPVLFSPLPDFLKYSHSTTADLSFKVTDVNDKSLVLANLPLNKIQAQPNPCVITGTDAIIGNGLLSGYIMGVDLKNLRINLLTRS